LTGAVAFAGALAGAGAVSDTPISSSSRFAPSTSAIVHSM